MSKPALGDRVSKIYTSDGNLVVIYAEVTSRSGYILLKTHALGKTSGHPWDITSWLITI